MQPSVGAGFYPARPDLYRNFCDCVGADAPVRPLCRTPCYAPKRRGVVTPPYSLFL